MSLGHFIIYSNSIFLVLQVRDCEAMLSGVIVILYLNRYSVIIILAEYSFQDI